MCSLHFKHRFFGASNILDEERRGECPQPLFTSVSQEISQPSILGSRERRVTIFVIIRKPSTAFVDQQFDSLCFMPCSQSMRHCFIIHASRGCHNACTTSHNTTQYHNTVDTTMPAQYKMQRTVYVVHCSSTVKYTLVFAKDTSHVHTAP